MNNNNNNEDEREKEICVQYLQQEEELNAELFPSD